LHWLLHNIIRMDAIKKLPYWIILSLSTSVLLSCENIDKFYRPNLPEKLCSIGIIDIDDTTTFSDPFAKRSSPRYISFEKSFQAEFPEEITDSLRGFSFSIYTKDRELVNYKSDSTIKKLLGFDIPHEIEFNSSDKYFMDASEANTPTITAECVVPSYPPKPILRSLTYEKITIANPLPCHEKTDAKSIVTDFSFENESPDSYYAILVEGNGGSWWSSYYGLGIIQIQFEVRDCNSPGFFSEMVGFRNIQYTCGDQRLVPIELPVYAYFIEGTKIPGNKCTAKISIQYDDGRSPFFFISRLRVRLLSIPKDLFLFEKGLYTYRMNVNDPFSEPVYLNGNIKDGNGVFAICRSRILPII
jgi:hypothetical protein